MRGGALETKNLQQDLGKEPGNVSLKVGRKQGGQTQWLSCISTHSKAREQTAQCGAGTSGFQSTVGHNVNIRNWQNEANWCEQNIHPSLSEEAPKS